MSTTTTTTTNTNTKQPPLGGNKRGWIGFGQNYFHTLTSSSDNEDPQWSDVPQESSDIVGEGGPYYSWGVDENNNNNDDSTDNGIAISTTDGDNNNDNYTKDPAATTTASTSISVSTYNRPLVAYQHTAEIPSKPKRSKKASNNKTQQKPDVKQVAPAACSSAASFFLSGSRHNRITTFGTIHGRVMNPVLESAQTDAYAQKHQQPPSTATWNPSMISPTTSTIALPLPVVELAAGRHFCLARLEGGLAVLSWGAGHFGKLGHGAIFTTDSGGNSTSTYKATPKVIDRLLPRMVGSPIAQIAAGDWHGMALTEGEGMVLAWGCNRNMQCGRKTPRANSSSAAASGSTNNSKAGAPAQASSAAPLQMTPQPVVILDADPEKADDPPIAIAKITCGKAHSVAISKTNQVYCWGASHYSQFASNSGSSVRSSKYTRNTTSLPRLVHSLQDMTVVDIAAGDRHTLALTHGGRVFSWGAGLEGQLGIFPPIVATPRP